MEITTFSASRSWSGFSVADGTVPGGGQNDDVGPGRSRVIRADDVEVRSGHFAVTSWAIPTARSASREPRVTRTPAAARRTASPRPAGPVPPSIPTCTPPLSHNLGVPMGLLRRKAAPDHRRAHRRLPGLRRGQAGPGGGSRDRSLGSRTGPLPHQTHRPETPDRVRRPGNRRHLAEQLAKAGSALAERWDRLDGILHAIGFAPPNCLGSGMFAANWDEVSVALNVSAYSLKALIEAFKPLLIRAGHRGGARWSDSTSTPPWPGRFTTGWGWPRRRSSR